LSGGRNRAIAVHSSSYPPLYVVLRSIGSRRHCFRFDANVAVVVRDVPHPVRRRRPTSGALSSQAPAMLRSRAAFESAGRHTAQPRSRLLARAAP
jgi:hypothetical protein